MKQKSNLKLHKYPLSNIILKNCSILGMYLFGGKFCKFMDEELGERECTCPEIIAKHPLCECDRKHFNNFLWATVTVFQVSLVLPPPYFPPQSNDYEVVFILRKSPPNSNHRPEGTEGFPSFFLSFKSL